MSPVVEGFRFRGFICSHEQINSKNIHSQWDHWNQVNRFVRLYVLKGSCLHMWIPKMNTHIYVHLAGRNINETQLGLAMPIGLQLNYTTISHSALLNGTTYRMISKPSCCFFLKTSKAYRPMSNYGFKWVESFTLCESIVACRLVIIIGFIVLLIYCYY